MPFSREISFASQVFLLLIAGTACGVYPWVKPEDLNKGLPPSVEIFTLRTTQSPFGTRLTGGFAKFNMSDNNLEFVVKDTNSDMLGYLPKTPMQYAEAEENIVYAVINGGYFDMTLNVSASLLAENGRIKSKNSINEGVNHYPTVGAFGLNENNTFAAYYVYSFGSTLQTYKFSLPNPVPGPVINKELGSIWKVKEAIGAGPIVINKGSLIANNVENFNAANMFNYRHPRSAICLDYNNNLYFVAIDGRYTDSDGLTIPELGSLMQDLFCFDAMNLDGGGSTLLFANGHIVNRSSDAAGPRPVVSAVLIRDRFKKKTTAQQS